jgi:ABC-type protease/lipase transport system fused ATPase/permease subunit
MLAHADKVLVMCEGLVEAFGPRNEIIGKSVRTTSPVANVQAVGV